jgi:hypothetical protein
VLLDSLARVGWAPLLPSFPQNRSELDRNEDVRELDAEFADGAGGRVFGEEFRIGLVEAGEIAGASEEDVDVDDVLAGCVPLRPRRSRPVCNSREPDRNILVAAAWGLTEDGRGLFKNGTAPNAPLTLRIRIDHIVVDTDGVACRK